MQIKYNNLWEKESICINDKNMNLQLIPLRCKSGRVSSPNALVSLEHVLPKDEYSILLNNKEKYTKTLEATPIILVEFTCNSISKSPLFHQISLLI